MLRVKKHREGADLRLCGHFDGSEAASHWLARLHRQYHRAGYREESELPASQMILDMAIRCSGDALTFTEEDTAVRKIVEKAEIETATVSDVKALEKKLKERFPFERRHGEFAQRVDEPLDEYLQRAKEYFSGGEDGQRVFRDGVECVLPRVKVKGFVDGLCDARLRLDAVEDGALDAKTLRQCFDLVRARQLEYWGLERGAVGREREGEEMEAIRRGLREARGEEGWEEWFVR